MSMRRQTRFVAALAVLGLGVTAVGAIAVGRLEERSAAPSGALAETTRSQTSPSAPAGRPPPDLAGHSPAQLAGQRVVFPLDGTTIPRALRARIATGRAGAVILFSRNVSSRAQVRRLTRSLQAIRRPRGLDAPLLVMVDQEGGPVKRLPGPPFQSSRVLSSSTPTALRAIGRATGRSLADVGVNVDLAPVADVVRPGSALAAEGRGFGRQPRAVAARALAFADGLGAAGVLATAKHFPGFGRARVSTDASRSVIRASAAALRRTDLVPFRALADAGVPLVMTSTAVYPALSPTPAALSPRLVRGLLRRDLGYEGVVVTDALDTPALSGLSMGTRAVRAAGAGNDLVLFAQSYGTAASAADALAAATARGAVPRSASRSAVRRILAARETLE
jgi:beta-N-acetylhexosaminidase